MKTNPTTTPKAKAAKKPTRSSKAKLETITLQPTAAQFWTWTEKAKKQGFPNVAAWALYNLTTHAWPSNRLAIIADEEDFTEWNRAAAGKNQKMTDWIQKTLNDAAFLINYAEKIEAIKDTKAFLKASQGGPISFEEFERSERYRASHPEESAEADRVREAKREAAEMLTVKISIPDAFTEGLDCSTLQSGLSSTLASTTAAEWVQQWTMVILKNCNLHTATPDEQQSHDFLLNAEHFERVREAAKSLAKTPEELLLLIVAEECDKMRWHQRAR